jgi:Glucose / Sorbosone dehydrogenase
MKFLASPRPRPPSFGIKQSFCWSVALWPERIAACVAYTLRTAALAVSCCVVLTSLGQAQITGLRIADYATMPMTGSTVFPSATANSAYLARVNFLADEPGGGSRFFVNDLNGPLYILDKRTQQFSTYLNFNGRDSATGLFDKFAFSSGFANGLITFQFDPDYRSNGKFYTIHMEQPSASGSSLPSNASAPGFNTSGYATTPAVTTPSGGTRQTVLIQWTDSNITNSTFEGTARELLRVEMSGMIHPMGDLIFNPLAGPGDPDWRVMYISVGDGGAGEQSATATRTTPQRLDTLGGKILRIIPDLDQHTETSNVSPNGRYRIPQDNPYTSINDTRVRDELFAVGLRNPHRMSWDVDPENPADNHLIVNDIGLHTWEEVNIIQPGRNFGYSQREGNERLQSNNSTTSLPNPDIIPVQITDMVTAGTIVPTYPVTQYGHDFSDSQFIGDSISSGYVYRGSRIPELYGKYIFGEITTGQILYADLEEMLLADDGNPTTMATIHSLNILWDNPTDSPNQGLQTYSTILPGGAVLGPMFQISERAYEYRGGLDPNLPGTADVTSPNGRADIRIQIDESGELFIVSKSDGMIRAVVGAASAVPGDYNRDGNVDAADYVVWRKSMGQQVAAFGGADGSGNGIIDPADYDFWRARFGNTLGSGVADPAAVPEPGATWLILIASAARVFFSSRTGPPRRSTGRPSQSAVHSA